MKPSVKKRKVIKAALVYAQEIVNMRVAVMDACEAAYFKAHPEALKYRDEIMKAANALSPTAP